MACGGLLGCPQANLCFYAGIGNLGKSMPALTSAGNDSIHRQALQCIQAM